MRHVIRSAFLVSLPLMVLGCAGDSPLGLDENASPPLLDMGQAPVGMVSGQFGIRLVDFNIQMAARPGSNGDGVGLIEWNVPSPSAVHVVERVTCLVIDGNIAWANAVVTSSNSHFFFPPGDVHTWIFRDEPAEAGVE